jgi:hypothetical protein
MPFVLERAIKTRERSDHRPERRAVGRSSRTPKRDGCERSEQSNPASRAAELRRSERTCLSSANDDEVDGLKSVIRSERSEQSNTVSEWGSDRRRDRPSARRKP